MKRRYTSTRPHSVIFHRCFVFNITVRFCNLGVEEKILLKQLHLLIELFTNHAVFNLLKCGDELYIELNVYQLMTDVCISRSFNITCNTKSITECAVYREITGADGQTHITHDGFQAVYHSAYK